MGGCAELDFVENNGNCAAATTFHTDPNGGDEGGTQTVNGISSHVHVHASWDANGDTLTVMVDGHQISGAGNPGSGGGDGNLGASTFSVSNLKIQGTVIKGPEPR